MATGSPLLPKTRFIHAPYVDPARRDSYKSRVAFAGGLSILPSSAKDIGVLMEDDRIKKLTFTGSPAVGWMLKSKAGQKKVTLELGGNAGLIVHSGADIETAIFTRYARCLLLCRSNMYLGSKNLRSGGSFLRVCRKVHRKGKSP